jgi:hypothetical protein
VPIRASVWEILCRIQRTKNPDAVRFRDHDLEVFGVVPDPLGQGENKFVMYERLCEELWFKVLKLCCRWYLSAMLEAFVFLR